MKRTIYCVLPILFLLLTAIPAAAKSSGNGESEEDILSSGTFAGLSFRGLGPGVVSGRVTDFAVDPENSAWFFVAVASGGVWKTTNGGATFEPVFDGEGSYSIGCITQDPNNSSVIWVGSGENNSQRSVSFGDGVYKSVDGGSSWTRMGLEESEHIGMIAVDPRDSNRVWVAAQGPLWRSGGHRGLYKTEDGGATWEKKLEISDDTGVNEVWLDPRNPDVIYASAYQRRRHVWTLINGGPESSVYKSTDGGESFRKIEAGLPSEDKGRIGLCVSPVNPDVVYAIVEAARDKGGFFRSSNGGEKWHRQSDHVAGSPQYYNEIVCDPNNVDRVYSLETWLKVTEDGGKSFANVPGPYKHVDDHALWIDPKDSNHILGGCDGGVYRSYDRGLTWSFYENLPITQFYRVGIDNSEPFYYIYGGTQDNATIGGPSRTTRSNGITNEDWFVTVFGDGFQTRVDPEDPMIVYSEWQYGGLVRHDRRSGEVVDIQPKEAPGEEAYRWNWDAPLIISPHSHTRLYFAASRLFRSDDRGNSWTVISDDVSRKIDRNALPVMGKVWSVDAVAKNASTSVYGNAVALAESPLVEGLLYMGTDDGLLHVSEDGGANWRVEDDFPGVPDRSYVSRLEASVHDADTVFAAFDNHKMGDFAPYLLKSQDRGRSWSSIRGNLEKPHIVWAVAQDHEDSDLLFAGTELGVFFTLDGGDQWIQLTAGLPTIAVRDLAIQRRENDLVLATFGRGFYILDDYTPLRGLTREQLEENASLFPVKTALQYIETSRLGLTVLDKAFQGDTYYSAPNPPYGAVFTYFLSEKLKSRKEIRHEAEAKAEEAGSKLSYPSWDELRAEDEEADPAVILVVKDKDGAVVQRVPGSREKGFHRVAWDLRYPSTGPVDLSTRDLAPWESPDLGPLALPGEYSVTLAQDVDGVLTDLAGPVTFQVRPLGLATFAAENPGEVLEFSRKAADLYGAVQGALETAGEVENRINHLKKAVLSTPGADMAWLEELSGLEGKLNAILLELRGDETLGRRNEATVPSIAGRVGSIVYGQWFVTSAPTATHRQGYAWAADAFGVQLDALTAVVADVEKIEAKIEAAGGPWTPGRVPAWEAK